MTKPDTAPITFEELAEALKEHEGETVLNGGGLAVAVFRRIQERRRAPRPGKNPALKEEAK